MAAAAEGLPTNNRLLYRIPEVVSELNVSRSKVYELLASGALRSVKIDRTRLLGCSDHELSSMPLNLRSPR